MIEFEDLLDNVNVEVKKYLDSMEMVSADKVGLDIRAGYELFVGEECIAVHSSQDRAFQARDLVFGKVEPLQIAK